MRNILVIGAGRSSATLIKYLAEKSAQHQFCITVADYCLKTAQSKVKKHPNTTAIYLDIFDNQARRDAINKASIVVSMLPAKLHIEIAKDCIDLKKNLVTASYISKQMKALEKEVKKNKLLFMNEVGLDPGIDHISAMHLIDRIRDSGGKMLLFESFTGGLIAPESDTNLWNYKFTWNPKNVVTAGQKGVAKFIQEGTYKYIPYHKLFRRTEILEIEGYGKFEAYANRDSLAYRDEYGLQNIRTLYRGTIRRVGFSRAWNILVQLGMTDDSYILEGSENMSYRDFTNAFLAYNPSDSVELKMRHYLKIDQDDTIWEKLLELDLFNANKKIGLKSASPAQALQKILENSWTLHPDDKDMVVMYHKFGFELKGKKKQIDSNMVVVGENQTQTAMAKTVGLPVAITTLLILNKQITETGVQIPIKKQVYHPILKQLEKNGIVFNEKETPYLGYNPE